MTLGETLSEEQIIPSMHSVEHWPAVVELVEHLVARGRIEEAAREPILEALRKREEAMSTGIGCGVAIPHTTSEHVTEVVAAFGRSHEGIEFNSLDGLPVKLIVLFIVPKDEYQLHLRTLAAIAKFFKDRAIRERLLAAQDEHEILQILSRRPGA
jgi:mannitol/fructose-specific phosphotransferase system IIA component (Ntr-type)